MKRRQFVTTATIGTLCLPASVRAQKQTTLNFIPQIDLTFLDPHFTPANVTRNHGFMVYDTLFGVDANGQVSPQMAEGHVVEEGGRLWRITLRDGLFFHDGSKVLARDCVASIKRWAKRDAFGEMLSAATDEIAAPDDRTIVFRLKKPFPLLAFALGKSASPMCGIMPERLAATDAFKQVTDITGSGPFRFKADERVQGARNVYEKFARYVPRSGGVPTWTAGPKLVHFDRVVWTTVPDNSTKANAMLAGEHDWWENPSHDLLGLLRKNNRLRLQVLDPTGSMQMMRPNHLQAPFSKPGVRRALLHAFDQKSFVDAIVGDETEYARIGDGAFPAGGPMASNAGLEPLSGTRDLAKVREMVKAAGYAGEKVVLIVPTDYITMKTTADIAADTMRRVGMDVDYVATDWGQMLTRRNNRGPVEQGGWSCFTTSWTGNDVATPAGHPALRGNGDQPSAWPGWYTGAEMERLRLAWFEAPDVAAQQKVCAEIQVVAMRDVPFWPLGTVVGPTVYRSDISGVVEGFAAFWGVARA